MNGKRAAPGSSMVGAGEGGKELHRTLERGPGN